MSIRAVIFDRDFTLLLFDRAAVMAQEDRIISIAPALQKGAISAYWARWGGPWPATKEAEPQFWLDFWASLGKHHGLSDATITELQASIPFYYTCFAAYPDTIPCIEALRACRIQTAVLTNFELPSVDLTFQYAGVDPTFFSVLLSSGAIGVKKPDPRAYLAVADALGLPVSDCAFIDDQEENVAAACAVGMRGILIDRNGKSSSSEFERIVGLDGLAALLCQSHHQH